MIVTVKGNNLKNQEQVSILDPTSTSLSVSSYTVSDDGTSASFELPTYSYTTGTYTFVIAYHGSEIKHPFTLHVLPVISITSIHGNNPIDNTSDILVDVEGQGFLQARLGLIYNEEQKQVDHYGISNYTPGIKDTFLKLLI